MSGFFYIISISQDHLMTLCSSGVYISLIHFLVNGGADLDISRKRTWCEILLYTHCEKATMSSISSDNPVNIDCQGT